MVVLKKQDELVWKKRTTREQWINWFYWLIGILGMVKSLLYMNLGLVYTFKLVAPPCRCLQNGIKHILRNGLERLGFHTVRCPTLAKGAYNGCIAKHFL